VAAAAYDLLKTENNPGGIDGEVFDGIKKGVLGDRRAYLAGLLRDVFLDATRSAAPISRRQCQEKSDILALEPFREALKRETPIAGQLGWTAASCRSSRTDEG
jgi:hypothetical protein